MRPSSQGFDYTVALSFAGEDRAYVERVAGLLRDKCISVFYDRYEEAHLWGKDLYEHLSDVYSSRSRYTVIFISSYYKSKLWTNVERRSAQERAFKESQEYILPARFDDSEIPGIKATVGYIDLRKKSPSELVDILLKKVLSADNVLDSALASLFFRAFEGQKFHSEDRRTAAANSATAYTRYCDDRYGSIRILSMPSPVKLAQIFTSVKVIDRIGREQARSEKEVLEEVFRADFGTTISAISAVRAAESFHRVVILGRPGSGKSTFLKFFLLKEIHSATVRQIPIIVHLNELNDQKASLLDTVSLAMSRVCGVVFQEFLPTLLRSGGVRLLFDGLDELRSDRRSAIVSELGEMMNEYNASSFIITCRTAAFQYWFADCRHFEVQRFSRKATVYFVFKWFSSERAKAKSLIRNILSDHKMLELCRDPLMLTIVCIAFTAGLSLSNNRAEIYKDAIETLLRKWDSTRNIQRENLYRDLSPKRREELLAELAVRTFVEGKIAIPSGRAREIVGAFVKNISFSASSDEGDDVPEAILGAIEMQHGLIERRSLHFWVFAHLTFQEYFVALYLSSLDLNIRSKVAADNVTKPEWREIISLTAALLPNCDEYVIGIMRSLTRLGYGSFFLRKLDADLKLVASTAERDWYAGNYPVDVPSP